MVCSLNFDNCPCIGPSIYLMDPFATSKNACRANKWTEFLPFSKNNSISSLISIIFTFQLLKQEVSRSARCRQNTSSESNTRRTLYIRWNEKLLLFDVNRWKFERELRTKTFSSVLVAEPFANILVPCARIPCTAVSWLYFLSPHVSMFGTYEATM